MNRKENENYFKELAILLGIAFDNYDGHKRVTKGDDFLLLGGAKSTHDSMISKVMEFKELLKKYNKKLENLSREEFYRIARELKDEKIRWHYHFDKFLR